MREEYQMNKHVVSVITMYFNAMVDKHGEPPKEMEKDLDEFFSDLEACVENNYIFTPSTSASKIVLARVLKEIVRIMEVNNE